MKVIDLFSGIGGFSLGLESTGGFETVQFVENNKWCQKVLAKNFPNVPITGDIRNYEGQEQADVVVGGFPCQPFSVAGKRKGTEDDRHLWPEMLRVIKASKPRWVIGENVRNLTSIQDGMVFEQVCTDLENEGYEVQSFIIPASAVNAPHQRYRVWIVAYSDSRLCRGGRAIKPSGENKDRELYSSQEEQTRKHLRSKTIRRNSVRGETENVADSESSKSRKQTEWKRGQDTERGSDDSRRVEREGSENVANAQCDGLTSTKKRRSTKETIRQESQGENRTLDSQGASGLSETTKNVADSKLKSSNSITDNRSDIEIKKKRQETRTVNGSSSGRDVPNSEKQGLEGHRESSSQELNEEHSPTERSEEQQRGMDHERFSVEPNVGRVAHGVSNRVDRIKGLGNAIVPQIAYQIGLTILEAENEHSKVD